MFKTMGVVATLAVGGAYFAGMFDGSYSRVVDRPQAEVMAALENLDITAQPGAPGSTATAAGGIQPMFRLAKTPKSMTWYVISGDKVATQMTATFEPVDGGKQTRIRTSVQRGNAPDDFVSPAFRSNGLTMALFSMAVEGEMNKLTMPPAADPEKCREMMDQFAENNIASGSLERPANLVGAVGSTAKTVMRLNAMEAELRRNGCSTDFNQNQFKSVSNTMSESSNEVFESAKDGLRESAHHDGVSFEPGKPMVDVRRR